MNLLLKFHDFFPWNNQDVEILSLGAPHAPLSPRFSLTKRRKGNKEKKRNSFKAETIQKLSPRSKCYCFSYPRASTIQEFYLQLTMVADNSFQYSMTPFTWNPFPGPVFLNIYIGHCYFIRATHINLIRKVWVDLINERQQETLSFLGKMVNSME